MTEGPTTSRSLSMSEWSWFSLVCSWPNLWKGVVRSQQYPEINGDNHVYSEFCCCIGGHLDQHEGFSHCAAFFRASLAECQRLQISLSRERDFVPFQEAQQHCREHYDDLSTVRSKDLKDLSYNSLIKEYFFWIGVQKEYNKWIWSEGGEATITFGQMDNLMVINVVPSINTHLLYCQTMPCPLYDFIVWRSMSWLWCIRKAHGKRPWNTADKTTLTGHNTLRRHHGRSKD